MRDGCDAYAYESVTFVSLGPPSGLLLQLLAREKKALIRLAPRICQPINGFWGFVFVPARTSFSLAIAGKSSSWRPWTRSSKS